MVRRITSTCMATLKNGVRIQSPDQEDKEHLTLQEELCEPDTDDGEDEEGEEDEEEDEHDNFMRRFLFSSHCTVCIYLALILLFVGSVVALIVISVQVVMPYENVRNYLNGTCIPTGLIIEDGKTCMCGAGCSAKYRCLTIKVTYRDAAKRLHNATVYENESTLGKQCSFYPPCKNSPTKIEESVREYEKRYGIIGLPFNCLFSPDNTGIAIRTKRFHLYHIVNGILWSIIVLIMAIIMLAYAVRRRGCEFL